MCMSTHYVFSSIKCHFKAFGLSVEFIFYVLICLHNKDLKIFVIFVTSFFFSSAGNFKKITSNLSSFCCPFYFKESFKFSSLCFVVQAIRELSLVTISLRDHISDLGCVLKGKVTLIFMLTNC